MGNPSDVEKLRVGIYGELKTCKTSFALSFPKPLVHLDLDVGFQRAKARAVKGGWSILELPRNELISLSLPRLYQQRGLSTLPDIITKTYQMPLKFPGQKITGVMALWEEVIDDILFAYNTPQIVSLAIDTGTVMHQVSTMAHLERVQAKNPDRQTLQQIEYARPNTEERSLLTGAYNYDKNLIITHHVGGVYKATLTAKGTEEIRVGDTWAGFNAMGNAVDIVARTYVKAASSPVPPVPHLWIEDCGLTLSAKGLDIASPSFTSLLTMINNLRLSEC